MVQLSDGRISAIEEYAEGDTINIIYNPEGEKCEGLCFGKPFGDAVKKFGLNETVSVYQSVMNRRFEEILRGHKNYTGILIQAYANGKLRDWDNCQTIYVLGENPLFGPGEGLSKQIIQLRRKLGSKVNNIKITVPAAF